MSDESMVLPPGMSCADCAHIRRCTAFGFTSPQNTACDFAPSRFKERGAQLRLPTKVDDEPKGRP